MEINHRGERIPTLSRVQIDDLAMVSNKMMLGVIMDALRQKYGLGEKRQIDGCNPQCERYRPQASQRRLRLHAHTDF